MWRCWPDPHRARCCRSCCCGGGTGRWSETSLYDRLPLSPLLMDFENGSAWFAADDRESVRRDAHYVWYVGRGLHLMWYRPTRYGAERRQLLAVDEFRELEEYLWGKPGPQGYDRWSWCATTACSHPSCESFGRTCWHVGCWPRIRQRSCGGDNRPLWEIGCWPSPRGLPRGADVVRRVGGRQRRGHGPHRTSSSSRCVATASSKSARNRSPARMASATRA